MAAELVNESTERTWRPRTGRSVNGFRKNESPALAAWSNSSCAAFMRSEALAADQLGRPEVVLGGLELVEAPLGVPAGLHQLEAGHGATTTTTTTTTASDDPAASRLGTLTASPTAGRREQASSSALDGSGTSDMGGQLYGPAGRKCGHTSYLAVRCSRP